MVWSTIQTGGNQALRAKTKNNEESIASKKDEKEKKSSSPAAQFPVAPPGSSAGVIFKKPSGQTEKPILPKGTATAIAARKRELEQNEKERADERKKQPQVKKIKKDKNDQEPDSSTSVKKAGFFDFNAFGDKKKEESDEDESESSSPPAKVLKTQKSGGLSGGLGIKVKTLGIKSSPESAPKVVSSPTASKKLSRKTNKDNIEDGEIPLSSSEKDEGRTEENDKNAQKQTSSTSKPSKRKAPTPTHKKDSQKKNPSDDEEPKHNYRLGMGVRGIANKAAAAFSNPFGSLLAQVPTFRKTNQTPEKKEKSFLEKDDRLMRVEIDADEDASPLVNENSSNLNDSFMSSTMRGKNANMDESFMSFPDEDKNNKRNSQSFDENEFYEKPPPGYEVNQPRSSTASSSNQMPMISMDMPIGASTMSQELPSGFYDQNGNYVVAVSPQQHEIPTGSMFPPLPQSALLNNQASFAEQNLNQRPPDSSLRSLRYTPEKEYRRQTLEAIQQQAAASSSSSSTSTAALLGQTMQTMPSGQAMQTSFPRYPDDPLQEELDMAIWHQKNHEDALESAEDNLEAALLDLEELEKEKKEAEENYEKTLAQEITKQREIQLKELPELYKERAKLQKTEEEQVEEIDNEIDEAEKQIQSWKLLLEKEERKKKKLLEKRESLSSNDSNVNPLKFQREQNQQKIAEKMKEVSNENFNKRKENTQN